MREYKKYFLDTNIFLRRSIEDNIKQAEECDKVFSLIEERKIKCVTSALVLAEFIWTSLRFYKVSKEKLVKSLKSLFRLKNLTIKDNTDFFVALELFENNNIKFIDAMIASNDFIRKNKAIIVSYDKDFDKIGVNRIEPGELIRKIK